MVTGRHRTCQAPAVASPANLPANIRLLSREASMLGVKGSLGRHVASFWAVESTADTGGPGAGRKALVQAPAPNISIGQVGSGSGWSALARGETVETFRVVYWPPSVAWPIAEG
jgi:hypothetical protein